MVEPRKFNPLEEDVAPPLDVKIDGVEYPIGGEPRSVTTEMLSECERISKEGPTDPDTIAKGLGVLLRVPAKTFKETDFRVLASALKWIQEGLMPEVKKVTGKAGGTKKTKKKQTGGQGKN